MPGEAYSPLDPLPYLETLLNLFGVHKDDIVAAGLISLHATAIYTYPTEKDKSGEIDFDLTMKILAPTGAWNGFSFNIKATAGFQYDWLTSNGDSTFSTYIETSSGYWPQCGKGPDGLVSSCQTNLDIFVDYKRQAGGPVFKDYGPRKISINFQTGEVSW